MLATLPRWIEAWLPVGLHERLAALLTPGFLTALGVFSVISFVGSLVGVPYFLTRLPPDYFSPREREILGIEEGPRPWYRSVIRASKNLLGVCLILAGIAMIVLPGQGLLTIFVGVLLVDFPGKRRLERWLIAKPSVLGTINALRRRAGRAPIDARASWIPNAPRSGSRDDGKIG